MKRSAQFMLLAASLVAAPAAPQEDPVFRSDVRLVNLLVTVRAADGTPVGGLTREDFKIVDGGEEREIAVFERSTNVPLSVMLLVDTSISTAIELEWEKVSAGRFVASLFGEGSHPDDCVALMRFSEGVDLLSGFTRSERQLKRALSRLKPGTGTSLYDAILLASEEISWRESRKILVIVTDGGDTTSYASFQKALEAAHAADVSIYSLIVTPVRADAGRNVGGENTLKLFARNTGGKAFIEYDQDGLDRAFGEILENLRTQYLLSYYPPEHTDTRNRFRRIAVEVNVPGAQVLARTGYYVPEDRGILRESIPPSDITVSPKPGGGWRSAPPDAKNAPERP